MGEKKVDNHLRKRRSEEDEEDEEKGFFFSLFHKRELENALEQFIVRFQTLLFAL